MKISGVVRAHQSLIEASIIASFLEPTLVLRVRRPRGWRVVLVARSLVVGALPITWRSGGRMWANASQAAVEKMQSVRGLTLS